MKPITNRTPLNPAFKRFQYLPELTSPEPGRLEQDEPASLPRKPPREDEDPPLEPESTGQISASI